ncbi:MAG: permease-like cell division protein FtsX [Peptococcaceae bacterium]|nr:permease-like cell division protein FtsX [Peptococcaceae bacterium]MBQ2120356.1 permease-like cell division protein FtsX [Peptococcaceae bacterium]MBQ5652999.1 permease-like cell division protein FtsX [Peptococcaceae bacterium]MBQ5683667.1 permease-like cell division protein FtsX [Peptococcaceae bacterium]MBQ5857877.1 permease-like cell division protein FtsX [Peptococcaceae bacterium]
MKFFRYLQYGFRDTLRSLWRHKGMVLVSVLTVATMLVALGAATLLAANSEYMARNLEEELEVIVYLNTDVTREEALALEPAIKAIEGYESSVFVPKEDALAEMSTRFDETNLAEALGGTNPLPDAYKIKLVQPEQIAGAVAYLENQELFPQIEMVRYGQDTVENMIALSGTMEIACIALIIGMLLIALFMVNSTIRLTVAARGEEINIMKYVGATNFYVRVPFFLEGLIIGIVGALLADVAIYFGYAAILEYFAANLAFVTLLNDPNLMMLIMLVLLVGGTLLGALGSNIAIKKYLKV